jgi:hypothetical protein
MFTKFAFFREHSFFSWGGGGAEERMSNSMLKLGTPERKVDKNYDPLFFY